MEQFALYFKQFISNGVYHTDNVPALNIVASTGLNSKISSGSAYIEGFMYNNTSDLILTHDVADATNPRIDRIVLRLDRSVNGRYIKAFVKKGTPATNPQPPALQRDSIIHEISLAQVRVNAGATTIASVTDERFDKSVAGLVTSLITIPIEDFQQEWDAWLAGRQSQWDTWFNSRQNQIGVKLTTGTVEPTGVATGDVWLKRL